MINFAFLLKFLNMDLTLWSTKLNIKHNFFAQIRFLEQLLQQAKPTCSLQKKQSDSRSKKKHCKRFFIQAPEYHKRRFSDQSTLP